MARDLTETEPVLGWRVWSLFSLKPLPVVSEVKSTDPVGHASQRSPTQPNWVLKSVYGNSSLSEEWPALEAVAATCSICEHPPTPNCLGRTCGIYVGRASSLGPLPLPLIERPPDILAAAFGPIEEPRDLLPEDKTWSRPSVVGVTMGWGRVVEDQDGWHAEYAKPVSIAVVCTECLVLDQRLTRAHCVTIVEAGEGSQALAHCSSHISGQIRRGFQGHLYPADSVEYNLVKRYDGQDADLGQVELVAG